jgi:hypothetical protein
MRGAIPVGLERPGANQGAVMGRYSELCRRMVAALVFAVGCWPAPALRLRVALEGSG